jgi:hypothetical protein
MENGDKTELDIWEYQRTLGNEHPMVNVVFHSAMGDALRISATSQLMHFQI